jgi:hypothetical protein
MDFRTRLTNWSLPVLLIGVPLCAALALEHASVAGQKARPATTVSRPAEAPKPPAKAPSPLAPR